jgi:hypothetical protein
LQFYQVNIRRIKLKKEKIKMSYNNEFSFEEIYQWNKSLTDWTLPITYATGGLLTSSTKKENFDIEKVLFNSPATIVWFKDGTKVVVQCQENDVFNKEVGLAMAVMKKAYGNKANFNNVLNKWCKEKEEIKNEK